MFDKYHINPVVETRTVPYEKTVIEKRAPTDESIRIYDEMLEKARLSYVESVKVTNPFEINIEVFRESCTKSFIFCYKTTMNGLELEGEIKQSCFPEEARFNTEEALVSIAKKMISDIAIKTVQQATWDIWRKF